MSTTSHVNGHHVYYDDVLSVWRFSKDGSIVNHETACSACALPPVVMELTIPADLSSTGEAKQKLCGIDACIAPIIKALNDGGVATIGCCCGHKRRPGDILLADGRVLIIASSLDDAHKMEAPFTSGIYP